MAIILKEMSFWNLKTLEHIFKFISANFAISDEQDEVTESEVATDEDDIKETAINTLIDQTNTEESESM